MKQYFTMISYRLAIAVILCLTMACSHTEQREPLKPIQYIGSYNRDFNDLNDLHLASAQQIGVKPAASREEVEKQKRKLREIQTGRYYELAELTHSLPYLTPAAQNLLEEIGRNFQDTLTAYNAPLYRIRVTSVLRTTDDVARLQKRNRNSSANSAHRYGTTFDVSWNRFTKVDTTDTVNLSNDYLKQALAMTLRQLQHDGRCYVKHERRQGCFHITVRKK